MKLAVILGSTREGRKSENEAAWVVKSAGAVDGIDVELLDLRDYPMPFLDEPISPRYNPNRVIPPDVAKWLNKVNEFDAYIFVTPEYNHSIPAVLKNAIDYMTWELKHKPAAVASHGSAGGARAAVHLKEILSESQAVVIPKGIAVTGMSELIDEQGNLADEQKAANPYGLETSLGVLLEELKWYSDALAAARARET